MEAEKKIYEFGRKESEDIGAAARDIKSQGIDAYRQAKEQVKEQVKEKGEELKEKGEELYDRAEGMAKDRYRKTAETVGETYQKAVRYGQENPERTFVLGLAVGVVLGLLFGGGFGIARSRHHD